MAKLSESVGQVFDYIQANDTGEGVAISEIANALGKEEKQVRPIVVLHLREKRDGSRGALATYVKKDIEGEDKPVGYAVLTEEGKNFVNADDEDED